MALSLKVVDTFDGLDTEVILRRSREIKIVELLVEQSLVKRPLSSEIRREDLLLILRGMCLSCTITVWVCSRK